MYLADMEFYTVRDLMIKHGFVHAAAALTPWMVQNNQLLWHWERYDRGVR
jgi:hypothetical protein